MRLLIEILIACLLSGSAFDFPTDAFHASVVAAKPTKKKSSTTKKKPSAGPTTSADAKKQRKETEKNIEKTKKQLADAEAELGRNLRKVSKLEEDIERTSANAARLKARIDSITNEARIVKDSIEAGEAELARLRSLYTKAVRSARKNRREMNATTFIFSASTFRQAWRRMHYLEEFSEWRKRKTAEINSTVEALKRQREALEQMKIKVQNLRKETLAEERTLRANKASLAQAVSSLQGKQKELNAMLKRQQESLRKLDRQIEELIQKEIEEQQRREAEEARRRAAEQKKNNGATDKKESSAGAKNSDKKAQGSKFTPGATAENSPGKFADQKGKLPSPLSHTYVVAQGFGIQQHRSIKTLEINNSGVDLETAPSATARAVYPGVVSAVFIHEGLGHVVLIRHGEYITVYANVKGLRVTKGDKLKTGDVIGSVAPSSVNPDRGMLHFEIRREREKINPLLWLKH